MRKSEDGLGEGGETESSNVGDLEDVGMSGTLSHGLCVNHLK